MARIGGFKTVSSGVHFEHEAGHVRQWGFVNARPLIDAVTGVEAHSFRRDAAQALIDRLDIDRGAGALPGRGEGWVAEILREERVVNLQQKTGVDNRLVFGAKRGAHGVEELFVALVIVVGPYAAGGD